MDMENLLVLISPMKESGCMTDYKAKGDKVGETDRITKENG